MLKDFSTLAAGFLLAIATVPAIAQAPPPENAPAPRRPFAPPDTPRQTPRIREADIKHIKAVLTLDAQKHEVSGTVTHTLTPLHPFFDTIELDCGPRLKVSKVTAGPNAAPCTFSLKGERLAIQLDKVYGTDDTIDLAITYAGKPETGLRFVTPDPAKPEVPLAIWTQGEAQDNHHWLPCYDYPNDRVTTEMVITIAKPLSVVSNGSLVAATENPDGTRTFHWKQDQPHSTYLITLTASEFATFHDRVGDLPVDYYVTKNVDEATARRFMGRTPEMIRFFNEVTGQPYPYPKYAQICLPDFNGGMENTSATSMTDAALLDEIEALERDHDSLVAHELAHQWFGDQLTCNDWSQIWLNEGFASYFDPLFFEHTKGDDEFRLQMDGALKGYLANDTAYRRPIVTNRYATPMHMFDGMTYAKGACVLHVLRGYLGDEAWWKGIKGYVAKHKFQLVQTDDFRAAMEEASGKDLKWFFDQWIFKAGHPELKVSWRYEDEDKTVRVKVEQTQKVDDETPIFRLPTTIELTDASGKIRSIPIVIDGASQELIISAEAKPAMVLIDPASWLIKELAFEKDVEEHLFQLSHAKSVIYRLEAAKALVKEAEDRPEVVEALAKAWKNEKNPTARADMVALIAGVESSGRRRRPRPAQPATETPEVFRDTLLEAAGDPEARVRVAAIRGLARLKRDEKSEAALRSAFNNPKEAYGARTTALRTLAIWKVDDLDSILETAVKTSVGKHVLGSTALDLQLEQSDARARELVALYARHGQPTPLRTTAIDALERLAKEDPALQDLIIPMIDDPDNTVRTRAWRLASSLKVKKALPALQARLAKEPSGSTGFVGFGASNDRLVLEQAINELKNPKPASPPPATPTPEQAKALADLQKRIEELEGQARDLRKQVETIKPATN